MILAKGSRTEGKAKANKKGSGELVLQNKAKGLEIVVVAVFIKAIAVL